MKKLEIEKQNDWVYRIIEIEEIISDVLIYSNDVSTLKYKLGHGKYLLLYLCE